MTTALAIIFWFAAALVIYTYLGYPLLIACLARRCGNRSTLQLDPPQSFSIIIAAHNEAANLPRRLEELTTAIAGCRAEIIVVSDGSTDATPEIARSFQSRGVRLLGSEAKCGKAAAISIAARYAKYDTLVFADVRQTWGPDCIDALLARFDDPRVGAVGGELVLVDRDGALQGVGCYWKFEKWLRAREARVHSTIGLSGAIAAVRRSLFRKVPDGTVLDDVYWPLCVVMSGHRVVFEPRAKAFDQLPPKTADEFRRKIRTQSGLFQLACRLPKALNPWHNAVWLQFCSHKLLRLAVPWAMLTMIVTGTALDGLTFRLAMTALIGLLLTAGLGLVSQTAQRAKPIAIASAFVMLNAAAWCGFWVWLAGRSSRSWHKAVYNTDAASARGDVQTVFRQSSGDASSAESSAAATDAR